VKVVTFFSRFKPLLSPKVRLPETVQLPTAIATTDSRTDNGDGLRKWTQRRSN